MKKARRGEKTPVRTALVDSSALQDGVCDGLGALKPSDREHLAADIRTGFADSLDIDTPLKEKLGHVERWDYLLGYRASGEVIAFEPHPATDVRKVIAKKKQAQQQLAGHLKSGARIAKWLWAASGSVHIMGMDKMKVLLYQEGIEFVGRTVMAKHLPGASEAASRPKSRRRR